MRLFLFSPGAEGLAGTDHPGVLRSFLDNPGLVLKGAFGSLTPVGVTLATYFENLESWVKLAALVLGGIVVPVYTILSIRKANRLRDLEVEKLEREQAREISAKSD